MRFSFKIFLLAICLPILCQAQVTNPLQINDQTGAKNPGALKGGTLSGNGANNLKAASDKLIEQGIIEDPEAIDFDLVKKYASTITAQELEAHLNFIASDELEGRETGTQGQRVAARYLATQFQRMGLKPGNEGSWFQEYKLNSVQILGSSLSMTGKEKLEPVTDYVYYNRSSIADGMSGKLAFAGYGIAEKEYDNLRGVDLEDKIVMVFAKEPVKDGKSIISGEEKLSKWSGNQDRKMEELRSRGAKGMITIVEDATFDQVAGSGWIKHVMTGSALTLAYKEEGKLRTLPGIIVPERVADLVFKKLKTSCATLKKSLMVEPKVPKMDFAKFNPAFTVESKKESVVATNVLGLLEGTDKKDEVVIITAHYDHLGIHDGEVFNGADDDGSGTVALLELAEAFATAAKEGHRPSRSILFMPVSGEEKGLLGSEYYADHPVYPLKKTVCDLNIDMIGRVDEAHKGDPNYIYVIGSDKLSTDLHKANERANEHVGLVELDYKFNSPEDPNRFYYRSDHYNFAKNNIPVIFYFSGVHEDYHKSTDTVEKILFPKMARVTQLVFGTAWDAANRKIAFVVDRKSDFENNR